MLLVVVLTVWAHVHPLTEACNFIVDGKRPQNSCKEILQSLLLRSFSLSQINVDMFLVHIMSKEVLIWYLSLYELPVHISSTWVYESVIINNV